MRPRNNPRNEEIMVPRARSSSRQKGHQTSVFWDKDGILLVRCLQKGATITAKHVAHLDKLKQQPVSKR
jgi:hypothetical protein